MQEPNRMYELEFPAPEVRSDAHEGPTLVIALQGYADGGHAVDGAARHLRAALESRAIASFSNDELIDYRSRRPVVTLNDDQLTDFSDLQLDMRVLRDQNDKPFLLLSGPEPDFRWESFTQAVADLADRYQVERTISLYASPMPVPHTRPMAVLAHGNSPDVLGDLMTWDARVTVPGAAALYIERELHERGHKVGGFTAQVPHYLAQNPYPLAALQLLTAVEETAGLDLPLLSLERDSERGKLQLAQQVASNEEIARVVGALEHQYDEEMKRYQEEHPHARIPGQPAVPSSEEIGQEFENFLASIDDSTSAPEDPTSRRRPAIDHPGMTDMGEDHDSDQDDDQDS